MVAASDEILRGLQERNAQLESENRGLREKLELLQEQVDGLLRRLYGRRSERFDAPGQQYFFPDLFNSGAPEDEGADEETIEYKRRPPRKRGPKPLPEHLPRDVVRLDPEESERICACCGTEMVCVDEVVNEELDVKPPEFRVKQYVRGKWCCGDCMSGTVSVPLPPRPIETGRPSPTLLAYIVVSKWADHLPIYRQEQIFKRYGIDLSRKTIDGWLGELAGLLWPIVDAIKLWLLSRSFLQSDDTPIRYLDRDVKGKSARGYLWSYGIPAGEVVYEFTTSRSQLNPLEFLDGFTGHLQTDGLEVYAAVYRSGRVEHIACMAHIRRKFEEARAAQPERVDEILDLIRALYALEREARENEVTGAALVELRRTHATGILRRVRSKIDELEKLTTPEHKLGKAVGYAQRQWAAMLRYVDVAEACLDNNWCENSLRPVVIGRKNFLFLGSAEGGGERASVFFSLIQSCRRLGVDPFAYLSDVIERISTHPQSRIDELTPRRWAELRGVSENARASPGG